MLEVRLFGEFDVRLDGVPVEIPSRPTQSLFAYLVLHSGTDHRRERLAGLFWPASSEENARHNLRTALWRLRKALEQRPGVGAPYLLVDDISVAFNPSAPYWCDATTLAVATDSVEREALLASVAVYVGELLPGFYDEWVVLEREHLQAIYEQKMQQLLHRLQDEQRWAEVLEWGERWIAMGQTPEPAYRALLTAHAALGNASKVATTFQRCADALARNLDVEPSDETRLLYEWILQGGRPGGATFAIPPTFLEGDVPAPGEPPFKGLHYFDEADADLFFGREVLTARLVQQVCDNRFLAVVGASGSGKSSLVRAGLVPALRRETGMADGPLLPEDSIGWSIHVITPTARPLEALAIALTRQSESITAVTTLMDDLASDARSLHLAVTRLLTQPAGRPSSQGATRLLLVVDQFEELFTLCRSDAERTAFVDNLLTAVAPEMEGPTRVVITLRADFYAHCAHWEQLRAVLVRYQEYIGPMNQEELRTAIEAPARVGGWTLEPGLVELLLRDVGEEPGALPLLSHALLETWRRRRGRTLTLAGYAEAGGVRGAIAHTAETVFHRRLTPVQQTIARSIFLRLTELGEGTQDTRRRVALTEVVRGAELAGDVEKVLQTLADARLITTSEHVLEVAHEALIREWPTLRQWLVENREGLRLHRHLTEAAQAWERAARDPDELYRGARLTAVLDWRSRHGDELNPLERQFLLASEEQMRLGEAAREAQHQRELAAAQQLAAVERHRAEEQAQAARTLRQRARVLVGALALATVLGVLALGLGRQAAISARVAVAEADARATVEAIRVEEQDLAFSRQLAEAARDNLEVDPERSILLALQAVAVAETREAEQALHVAVLASRIQHTFTGHVAPIIGLAVSPDGSRLATGGGERDRTIRLWAVASGETLLTLEGHEGSILNLDFSPDGTRLASVSADRTTRIWDAQTGEELFTLTGHERVLDETNPFRGVRQAVFHPDGRQLLTVAEDGKALLWDAASGRRLRTYVTHDASVLSVSWDPSGTRFATASVDGTARVWDVESGNEQLVLQGHGGALTRIAFSPDGTRLATASLDGTARIWDAQSGEAEVTLVAHTSVVHHVAWHPTDDVLATASEDGTARLWNGTTGAPLFSLAGHTEVVFRAAFFPNQPLLATASGDQTARVWDVGANREWFTVQHDSNVSDIAYHPDGTQIAAGDTGGMVRIWEVGSGADLFHLRAHDGAVQGLAYSPDGTRLATAGADGTVKLWDAGTGTALLTLEGHGSGIISGLFEGVYKVAFSPDGTRLATAGADGTARIWEVASGNELLVLSHAAGITDVAFSPDSRQIATASDDKTAKTWDATTGQALQTFGGHNERVWGVAFSPDGAFLATGSGDATVIIWELSSGEEAQKLIGHRGGVFSLAYSPDGQQLATTSLDGTTKVWNLTSANLPLTLVGHIGTVSSVAFSPDGTRLATSGADGTVQTYLLQLEALVDLARSRVVRALTPAECQQFLLQTLCP